MAKARGSHPASGPAALREAYCSLLAVAIDRIMDTMAKDEEGSGMSHETLQRYLQDRKHVIQLAAVHTSRRKRLSVLGLRFHENGSCYPISSSEQSVHLRWYHMRRYLLPTRWLPACGFGDMSASFQPLCLHAVQVYGSWGFPKPHTPLSQRFAQDRSRRSWFVGLS